MLNIIPQHLNSFYKSWMVLLSNFEPKNCGTFVSFREIRVRNNFTAEIWKYCSKSVYVSLWQSIYKFRDLILVNAFWQRLSRGFVLSQQRMKLLVRGVRSQNYICIFNNLKQIWLIKFNAIVYKVFIDLPIPKSGWNRKSSKNNFKFIFINQDKRQPSIKAVHAWYLQNEK